MNIKSLVKLFLCPFLFLTLQACAIQHFETRGLAQSGQATNILDNCSIKFHIDVLEKPKSKADTSRLIVNPEFDPVRYAKNSTLVISEKGCVAEPAPKEDSDLLITIYPEGGLNSPGGPKAMRVLSGLTLWIIPTWSTDIDEHKYGFLFSPNSFERNYSVDKKKYFGWIFLPVSIPFVLFTRDENEVFREALADFLDRPSVLDSILGKT